MAFLITFIQSQGLPIVLQCDYYEDGTELNVNFTGKSIWYKTKVTSSKEENEKHLLKMFNEWKHRKGYNRSFKKLQKPFIPGRKQALINISYLINKEAKKEKQHEGELRDISIPTLAESIVWFAPIRTEPRRTYDEFRFDFTSEGSHTPYLIRKILDSHRLARRFRKFMSTFGHDSALLDSISIQDFGHKPTSPFGLNIVLNQQPLNVVNVGYGVSQCLPLVVELFARGKYRWFSMQQPEIHLHPKAQAALGDMFYQVAADKNQNFLIETHSDYVIDRFRLKLKHSDKKIPAQVLFFERTPSGNKVTPINIGETGEYSSDQPKRFREFFIKEELRLLGLR